jgi:hypothetical protein
LFVFRGDSLLQRCNDQREECIDQITTTQKCANNKLAQYNLPQYNLPQHNLPQQKHPPFLYLHSRGAASPSLVLGACTTKTPSDMVFPPFLNSKTLRTTSFANDLQAKSNFLAVTK